jgi:uncharacterized protein
MLAGVEAGLAAVPVAHAGRSTASPEEAAEVVRMVRELLGTPWSDAATGRVDDPFTQADFIVVTPYNAQRGAVVNALTAAGLDEVRVAMVDKFQGQEAVVSIVTLTASSAADVPRGIESLINRNRLNVAIARQVGRAAGLLAGAGGAHAGDARTARGAGEVCAVGGGATGPRRSGVLLRRVPSETAPTPRQTQVLLRAP